MTFYFGIQLLNTKEATSYQNTHTYATLNTYLEYYICIHTYKIIL